MQNKIDISVMSLKLNDKTIFKAIFDVPVKEAIFIPFKKTEKLSDINRIIESAEKMGWGCVMDLETEFIVCRPLVTEKEVVV